MALPVSIHSLISGREHEQLRAALRYIKNMIITEKVVKHPDRAEADRFFNYPYAAIEEALANAVYHKAYDEREPIEVRVNHDMIEIISHPGPDRSVTIQGLKEYKVYSRRYRNRRIGEFLKDLHLTEGRNTGFKKILGALRANGSPLPEFETDEAHDYFVTRIFIHEDFYDNGGSDGGSDGGSITSKIPLTETQSQIVNMLLSTPSMTKKEMAEKLGLSTDGVKYHIKKMTESGIVRYVGTSRNGHWELLR